MSQMGLLSIRNIDIENIGFCQGPVILVSLSRLQAWQLMEQVVVMF